MAWEDIQTMARTPHWEARHSHTVPRILQIHKTTILSTVPRFMASEHTLRRAALLPDVVADAKQRLCCQFFFLFPSPSLVLIAVAIASISLPHASTTCQMVPDRSSSDRELIDGLSNRDLQRFRIHMYGQSYKDHPERFLDDSWINADELRKFLSTTHCVIFTKPALSEFPEPQNQIKRELDASDRDIIQLAPHPQSELTADNDVYNTAPTSPTVFDPADDIDDPLVWHPSDTQWMDPGLTSLIFTASIARARIVLHKLQKLGADIPRVQHGSVPKPGIEEGNMIRGGSDQHVACAACGHPASIWGGTPLSRPYNSGKGFARVPTEAAAQHCLVVLGKASGIG
ncbi:hypothetical protein C8J57DRAFT_1257256 [Mycena rebaudengoi]|nr:hypothetical protein C8J57DRAFT_1257256 [Mycena rebaudengoi]